VTQELRDGQQISEELLRPRSQEVAPVEIRTDRKYPLISDPKHRQATEDFGVLRTRLLNARARMGITSVLMASAQAQEGKSLISINLALSLAELRNERILLVDGDLRISGISRLLGLQGNLGLADFLHGREPFDACVRATTFPSLWIAPAGNLTEDSLPSILEGARWPGFLDKAKREFGLIIVDSVPVSAPIADFELLMAGCDAALLVVQLRKTTREALDVTSRRLNGKLLGLVVNNTEPRNDVEHYRNARGKKNKD
jgi:capsular exopolysaccharide synthesis family protein